MQNNNQYENQQPYGPPINGPYQYVPAEQAMSPEMPQYHEENWLEPGQPKKGHPVLKTFGLLVLLVGLFCMSALAGMMSEGKRPYLALFKNNFPEQHAEVKGASTDVQAPAKQYSGLAVGSASEVGQANPTNDNNATLSPGGPFYQYVDTLGSDQITVARQPLPDDFSGNPANLQGLAARIGANQPISTEKWGTAYMMTSGDVQVVAIANNKHLVFLRSTQLHTKDTWKRYIDTFMLR